MDSLQRGIWSGAIATGPMTLALFRIHKELPKNERLPLPPAKLTQEMTAPFHSKALAPNQQEGLTMLSHFAYGLACGVVYAVGRELFHKMNGEKSSPERLPPSVVGGLFGLGVWAFSYLGWIPMAGFQTQAPKMSWRRNVMMIFSHWVWGSSLGLTERELRERGASLLDGRRVLH